MKIDIRRLRFLVLGVLLLAACGAAGPAVTVQKFYGYLEAGRAEQALGLFSQEILDDFGREKLLAGVRKAVQDIEAKGGVNSFTVESQEIEDDMAMVGVAIEYRNGERSAHTAVLVKERNAWRLAVSK